MKNLHLFRLVALVATMMCALGAVAQEEAYVIYTPWNSTLSFCYDSIRSTWPIPTYDLNTGNNDPDWLIDLLDNNLNLPVKNVVINPAFANVHPTSTASWFSFMLNLESMTGLQYLNTDEVTTMHAMFYCCNLTSLDVSNFNTDNVTDMSFMFSGCYLKSLDVSNFNTSKVTKMNYMFAGCDSLASIDVSNFNTDKVTDMSGMFQSCRSMTSLDLSNFNTTQVTNLGFMFNTCKNLQTIYVGENWNTAATTFSNNMFMDCTNIVGGMGTTYDANHVDAAYAHIDGGPSNPGYFSEKPVGMRGDVNFDGILSIADVTELIDILLNGLTPPECADCNLDGNVSIGDVTALIDYLLMGDWQP